MIVMPPQSGEAFILPGTTMIKYFIVGFFCLLSLFIAAQDAFLVYSIRGEVTVASNNTKSKVTTGTMLPATAVVNVPAEGAITFICKEGGMFSITKEGSCSLNSFRESCSDQNSILLTGYSKFFWDQFAKPSAEKGKNRRDYFPNYKVRIRDHWDIWIDPMFDTVNYSGHGDFPLSWVSFSKKRKFSISLYRPGNSMTPFYVIPLTTSKINLSNFLDTIKQGNSCYWGVSPPGEESDELNVFNYVSGRTYDSVLTSIKKLRPMFEAPAEEAFRTAFMLENAHYFAEAREYYAKATILDPTNKFFWTTSMWFKKVYEIDNR